jgi:hypothetical protein
MPTLSKAQLIQRESPWQNASDRIYQELCRNRVPILVSLGYYKEHNLPVPEADPPAALSRDEETEIKPIAGALSVAAGASQVLPRGELIATLKRVSKEPCLLRQGQLPEEVEWAIARSYQRLDELPGTHWYDVWHGKLAFPEGKIEMPTDLNIAKAALAAIGCIQSTKSRGRPPNLANQVLANELGEIFRGSGQRIARHWEWHPVMRDGRVISIECGPFYDFLGLVLPPLQAYLLERKLSDVTVATIVRIAAEGYLKTR